MSLVLSEQASDVPGAPEHEFRSERLPRLDSVDKATGRAVYAPDVHLDGMLQGKILRSPHPHARIVRIDISRATELPGVEAVVTATDAPEIRYGHAYLVDRVLLARDKVRYVGEPVAVVAARSAGIAEEALRLIEVEYEELSAVFDVRAALDADAPIIHEELAAYATAGQLERRGNLAARLISEKGAVDEAFAQADLVIEEEYLTSPVHQSYLEPHTSVAEVSPSGQVTIWTSTQFPFGIRAEVAKALDIPLRRIRVIPTTVGGAFGGKIWMVTEPLCVLLAQKAGKPVRIELRYEEEFLAGRPRVGCSIRMRTAVRTDGQLLGRDVHAVYDTGAYAYLNPASNAASIAAGPYRLPALRVTSEVVYTNKHSIGAMRGPGGAQMVFAVESHMDSIARRLGIDPLELRMRNAVTDEDFPHPVGFVQTLRSVRQATNWDSPTNRPFTGRGVACAQWGSNGGASPVTITLDEDGSLRVMTGSIDLTGSDAVIAQIAAHELGVAASDIRVTTGDTELASWTAPSAGSRMTYSMGNAARLAAIDVRTKLLAMAAQKLEVAIEDLRLANGCVFVHGSESKRLTFEQLAGVALGTRGPIVGTGSVSQLGPAPSFIAVVADVEVDPDTGLVRVLQFVVAEDVGKALNPLHLEGQIEGGMALGVGQGLLEAIQYSGGEVINPRFGEYQLPRSSDVPRVRVELVEVPSRDGPYGARGAGEPGGMPGAAAIANAVYAATGVKQYALPITPERVQQALLGTKQI